MFSLFKDKNTRNFFIKTGMFLLIVFAGFSVMPHILGKFITVPMISTNFDRNLIYALFYSGLFLLMIKDEIKNISLPKQNWFETVLFSTMALTSIVLVNLFLGKIVVSSMTEVDILRLYYMGIFLHLVPAVLVWLALFGLDFSKRFIKRFGNLLLLAVVLFLLTAIFSAVFQANWVFFSTIIAKSVSLLLSLTFNSSVAKSFYGTPTLSLEGFTVNIGAPCSGIESASLFIFFYLAIVIFDWKTINRKLAAVLWIPGIIGMYLMNIIRIYLLMLVGYLISPKLAISIFHENAGWIIFVLYIFVFWYFAYPRIKKKK